jgi:hypothetical protein
LLKFWTFSGTHFMENLSLFGIVSYGKLRRK